MKEVNLITRFVLIVGFWGCNGKNYNSSDAYHSEDKKNKVEIQIIEARDKIFRVRLPQPQIININDSTFIEYFKVKGSIKKVNYIITTSEQQYVESFYLNYPFALLAYSYPIDESDTSYTLFMADRKVISYIGSEDIKHINELDSFAIESKTSTIAFNIDRIMSYLPGEKYIKIIPSLNSIPSVKVSVDSICLNSASSLQSSTMKYLQKNEHLFYLGCEENIDTKYKWYKVATNDKKYIGWIFCLPYDIELLTDENW